MEHQEVIAQNHAQTNLRINFTVLKINIFLPQHPQRKIQERIEPEAQKLPGRIPLRLESDQQFFGPEKRLAAKPPDSRITIKSKPVGIAVKPVVANDEFGFYKLPEFPAAGPVFVQIGKINSTDVKRVLHCFGMVKIGPVFYVGAQVTKIKIFTQCKPPAQVKPVIVVFFLVTGRNIIQNPRSDILNNIEIEDILILRILP